jgi:hypothetical protein
MRIELSVPRTRRDVLLLAHSLTIKNGAGHKFKT